jgi:beta-mannosidase
MNCKRFFSFFCFSFFVCFFFVFLLNVKKTVALQAGETQVTVELAASAVNLWWPHGYGAQTLYNVTVALAAGGGPSVAAARRIGFRLAALVTGNDTDPAWVRAAQGQEGTGNHTFMYRINGVAMAVKGANMIPMEILEGRYVPGMHRQLVASAAAAGMTILRVWGGGIYPFEEWFDACDELGVLVFQDMMYGGDGIQPLALDTPAQQAELVYQVRRMASHPSIVTYSGCNECDGTGIYTSFVVTTVVQEDASRPVRSSCPWAGYASGVHLLSQIPTGGPLAPLQLADRAPSKGFQVNNK